jgi:hypothetical protein
MKKGFGIVVLLFFLTLNSCQYFKKNVPDKEILLEQELKKVNWNKVDEMPTISYCDSLESRELRETCFFDYFKHTIEQKLQKDSFKKSYPLLDSLKIRVIVNPDASLKFEPSFDESDKQQYDVIEIENLLQNTLTNFSTVQPAIKRGIKVKSEFYIEIAVK